MPPEAWVPLAVAVITGIALVGNSYLQKRMERRQIAEQAGREAVEDADEAWREVFEQRLTLKDETIADLRLRLVDRETEIDRLRADRDGDE